MYKFRLKRTYPSLKEVLDHPGTIQVPTGAPKWPKTVPKLGRMAQNHQNGSKWHCMTPNGPSGPKTVLRGIIYDYMPCWTTLGPFQRPTGVSKWPKTAPKWPYITQNGLAWPHMALHDPKWPKWP